MYISMMTAQENGTSRTQRKQTKSSALEAQSVFRIYLEFRAHYIITMSSLRDTAIAPLLLSFATGIATTIIVKSLFFSKPKDDRRNGTFSWVCKLVARTNRNALSLFTILVLFGDSDAPSFLAHTRTNLNSNISWSNCRR
jgi:hypothetical protein